MTTQSRLLVTRPRPQADRLAAALQAAHPGRWQCTIAPLLDIVLLDAPIATAGVSALLFTSANGVAAYAEHGDRRDLPAYCAGASTTAAAVASGLTAHNMADTAEGLAQAMAARAALPGALLHVTGAHRTGDLAAALRGLGHTADTCIAYEQRAVPLPCDVLADLGAGRFDTVTLFSPRTARLFATACAGLVLPADLRLLCLSAGVAVAVRGLTSRVEVAPSPDQNALISRL